MSIPLLIVLAAAPVSAGAPKDPARSRVAQSTSTAVDPTERRRALHLTDLLTSEGRLREAEAFIEKRIVLNTDKDAWLLRRARIRSIQRRHGEAADVYEDILSRSPDDPGLLVEAGRERFANQETAKARALLERARSKSSDPVVPYVLSELEFAEGRDLRGKELAAEALKGYAGRASVPERRTALRLRSRLGVDDALLDAYAKLYAEAPSDADTLVDWADTMFRAGLYEGAREPVALLRESGPDRRLSWRKLEADRLRHCDPKASAAFLEEAAKEFPEEAQFPIALGDQEVRDRRWGPARRHLRAALNGTGDRRWAEELYAEVRRRSDHHVGPVLGWRESRNVRAVDVGARYFGYPREGLRLDAQAVNTGWTLRSRGGSGTLTGGSAALSWETPDWTKTVDFDLRSGSGLSSASPGLKAVYEPRSGGFYASASESLGRIWSDSIEAVAARVKTDEFDAVVRWRPLPRLWTSLHGVYDRLSAKGGGRAAQVQVSPGAELTLLQTPFTAAASWRLSSVDASGDAAFFSALPLQRRSRTQYGTLAAGKSWLAGRLRADGYVFNGHDPANNRRFASFDLVGGGANLYYEKGHIEVAAGWALSLDNSSGIGGRSQSANLELRWRWEPR